MYQVKTWLDSKYQSIATDMNNFTVLNGVRASVIVYTLLYIWLGICFMYRVFIKLVWARRS